MSKRLDENLGSVGYDGLIVANEPVADVLTVTIRQGRPPPRPPISAALCWPCLPAPPATASW